MNLANFHHNTWNCQNWYFHGTILSKVENAWATILQRSYKQWHWRMMKNLKRKWLVVSNWHKEFDEFWLENLKVSKIYFLMGCFWPKCIIIQLKKVLRSYVSLHLRLIQSLKENWLVLPKIDMRNLANFHQSTWKSPNWDLDGILLSKVENVRA